MKNVSAKIIKATLLLALIVLGAPMAQADLFTMNDLNDLERETRIMRVKAARAAVKDTSFAPRATLNKENEDTNTFAGSGHKVGGSKYANRLLGISEEEGRRLAKEARSAKRDQEKAAKKAARRASKSPLGLVAQSRENNETRLVSTLSMR